MTKRSPSLLGSWIDLEATSLAARALCPQEFLDAAEPSEATALKPGALHTSGPFHLDRFPSASPVDWASVGAPVVPAPMLVLPAGTGAGAANGLPPAAAAGPAMPVWTTPLPAAVASVAVAPVPPAPPVPVRAEPTLDSADFHARLTDLRQRLASRGLLQPAAPTRSPNGASPADVPAFSPAEPPFAAVSCMAPFVPPLGPLNLRARALSDWLHERFDPAHIAILDDQGRPLVDTDASVDTLATATVLLDAAARASRHFAHGRSGAAPGLLHYDLGPGHQLTLVAVPTDAGIFAVAMVRTAFVDAEEARAVSRALKKTLEAV